MDERANHSIVVRVIQVERSKESTVTYTTIIIARGEEGGRGEGGRGEGGRGHTHPPGIEKLR